MQIGISNTSKPIYPYPSYYPSQWMIPFHQVLPWNFYEKVNTNSTVQLLQVEANRNGLHSHYQTLMVRGPSVRFVGSSHLTSKTITSREVSNTEMKIRSNSSSYKSDNKDLNNLPIRKRISYVFGSQRAINTSGVKLQEKGTSVKRKQDRLAVEEKIEEETQNNGISACFRCTYCDKTYSKFDQLRIHQRRHASKRSSKYQCKVCASSFVQRSSLNTHLRIHTGEKPYQCLSCTAKFGDFSTFTKHKRIHTGERPYSCPVCQRAFSQSGNMHRHLKTVHR